MRCILKKCRCKRSYGSIIHKRRYKSRQMRCSIENFFSPSGVDLDNISEAIRINRCKRTEGKGAWKVLPKDSWDLYDKHRKVRQFTKKNIKKKNKSEKPKADKKMSRGKSLQRSKKLNRKRRYWGQINNDRKKNSMIKKKTHKRSRTKSYGLSNKKTR